MIRTTDELRKRIATIDRRIVELTTARRDTRPTIRDASIAAAIDSLRGERAAWQTLLLTRRARVNDRVVDLRYWRDGSSGTPRPAPEGSPEITRQAAS